MCQLHGKNPTMLKASFIDFLTEYSGDEATSAILEGCVSFTNIFSFKTTDKYYFHTTASDYWMMMNSLPRKTHLLMHYLATYQKNWLMVSFFNSVLKGNLSFIYCSFQKILDLHCTGK